MIHAHRHRSQLRRGHLHAVLIWGAALACAPPPARVSRPGGGRLEGVRGGLLHDAVGEDGWQERQPAEAAGQRWGDGAEQWADTESSSGAPDVPIGGPIPPPNAKEQHKGEKAQKNSDADMERRAGKDGHVTQAFSAYGSLESTMNQVQEKTTKQTEFTVKGRAKVQAEEMAREQRIKASTAAELA